MAARRRRSRRRQARTSRKRTTQADSGARARALEALSRMRSEGLSLTRAAQAAHTTPATVRRFVGSAVTRQRNGRYAAKPSDRLTRHVWFLTRDGPVEVALRGSRPAERVASYMAAVDRYLKTGDTDGLAAFEGRSVRSRNQAHLFLTDTEAIDRLANAGEVSFDRLYSRRA